MNSPCLRFLVIVSFLCGAEVRGADDPAKNSPPVPSAQDLYAYRDVEKVLAEIKADPKKRAVQFSEKQLLGWVRTKDFLTNHKGNFSPARWSNNYLDRPASIETFPAVAAERFAADPIPEDVTRKQPKASLHLRQSYTDVLATEDPTLSIDPNKRYDDLKGALVTYTRDHGANTDTWSAQGALLLPLVWVTGHKSSPTEWTTLAYGFIPSVSVFRVDNNKVIPAGQPTNEVDQLSYRAEIYGKYSSPWAPLETVTLRGFGAYVTDTGHNSGIPVFQLELEPQLFFHPGWAIGYQQSLLRGKWRDHQTGIDDYFAQDDTLLGYQCRFRFRGEVGKVTKSGKTGLIEESFMRGGPIGELKLWPIFTDRLSLTVSYSYLPAAFGPNDHADLFSANAEFVLVKRPEAHQTLSLKGSYTKGGIDVTQQNVDTFQFGFAATF
jgi:hypothetical protein